VAPLRLGGLRGKKSTPSDWLGGTGVVLRSVSGSGTERVDDTRSRRIGKGTPLRLNDRLCRMYEIDLLCIIEVVICFIVQENPSLYPARLIKFLCPSNLLKNTVFEFLTAEFIDLDYRIEICVSESILDFYVKFSEFELMYI
jgi:hypothetical protein